MTFRKREESLDREIADYLERETRDNMDRGMTEQEARAAARRKLGNATLVKEDTRAAWGWVWVERLFQDLRQAWRMLAKNPGFTAVAVLSLAIGVGANCAIFSLADMMLLRPLPVPNAGQVVTLGSHKAGGVYDILQASYPDYEDLRDNVRSFTGVEAHTFSRVRFARGPGGLPDLKMAMSVSDNFFDVLDVAPELGRGFRPEEGEAPGRDAVLVLSHSFWRQEFGGDPQVLGTRVRVNDIEFTIVGVAPERFTSVDQWVHPTFYLPAMMQPRLFPDDNNADPMGPLGQRGARYWTLKGRLRPGVSIEEARAEVEARGAVLGETYPETNREFAMTVRTETEARALISQGVDRLVPMLLALAGAVLFVACANVAGLLTSRAPSRAREIAVRMAVGAGRTRLVRQLFTESVLLAAAGGVAGVVVGYAGIALLDRFTYTSDIPVILSVRMDERTLLFGLAAAALSVVTFGLLPAIRGARADLVADLKNTGVKPRRRTWGRNVLVSGQVAVALVLLAMSSFMYMGFRAQLQQGPGFRTDHLLMLEFDPHLVNYTPDETRVFYDDVSDRVRELPVVRSATLASFVPLTQEWRTVRIVPEGFELPAGSDSVGVMSSLGDESYFDTLAMPILEGRGFRVSDDEKSVRVAVVNEALAARYWPGASAVGKRFRLGGPEGGWVEIVGLVRNAKYAQLGETPTPFVVLPYAQNPRNDMILMVESTGDPARLAGPVREVVRQIDPEQPVFEVRTMEAFFEDSQVTNTAVVVQSVGAMGVMGIALALAGLYGLVAFMVNTRTQEIGIRMALGAGRAAVLRMVLRQGMVLALSGVAVGLAMSAGAALVLDAVFPGGEDGARLAGLALVVPAVMAVTLLAAYVPARRASRIDPIKVLRHE